MSTVNAKDVQRLFLQAVLSRGVLSGKLAQALWAKAKDAVMAVDNNLDISHSGTREEWEAFVIKVNQALDPLDLEFRHLQEETTGREMYAIVNRKGDEVAQMATDYTPTEIAFFKALVDQIMSAPRESFSISSLAALREVSVLKKSNMTKTQAEVVLSSFVAKGWLQKSKRGRYSLSTRALLELQPYLKSTFPDEVIECVICFEIMTKGIACTGPNCQVRMHYHCFTKYTARNRKCPTCNCDWPGNDPNTMTPVGESAARDGDDGRRRIRKSVENSDDEEEEDEQADEPSQPRTQQSRKNKTKAAQTQSMDVDEDESEGEESDTPAKTQGTRRSSRRG